MKAWISLPTWDTDIISMIIIGQFWCDFVMIMPGWMVMCAFFFFFKRKQWTCIVGQFTQLTVLLKWKVSKVDIESIFLAPCISLELHFRLRSVNIKCKLEKNKYELTLFMLRYISCSFSFSASCPLGLISNFSNHFIAPLHLMPFFIRYTKKKVDSRKLSYSLSLCSLLYTVLFAWSMAREEKNKQPTVIVKAGGQTMAP